MKVYLIRHGETEFNAERKAQGWCDVKLTENGMMQAAELGEGIKNIKFDRIISSDLVRAKQTANIIFGNDPKTEYDERLREVNNTVLAGRKIDELVAAYGEKYRNAGRHFDYSDLGGESFESLRKRTADFLDDLKEDKKSEKIAVVTHGGTLLAIISNVLGHALTTSDLAHAKNCSVTVLELKDGDFRLELYNYVIQKLS